MGGWQDFNLTIGDIALRSVYTPIEYTVTFVANGKAVDTRTYNVEDTRFTNPYVPNKTGYTGKWEPFTVTHGDMTVNAVYSLIPYTVTFVANGQTVATETYDVEHKTVQNPTVPDKEHYTGKWNDYKLTHGNVTVNATYTPVPYTVTFVANGQTVKTETYDVENTTVQNPTVPVKDHYDGTWENFTLTHGNVTVNAVYTATKYTVTFVANGQTVTTETYTVENTTVETPALPDKEHYTGKWNDFTLTHGNVTVNATYTAIVYTVTFVANGETVGSDTYTVEDKTFDSPTVPDKEHYDGAWENVKPTGGNLTVNAVYTAVKYTVTFVANGKTVTTKTYTVENTTVQNPEVPSELGYNGEWNDFTLTHGNVTVNAVYTAIEYKITFVANGQPVGYDTYTVEDKTVNSPTVPDKEHYTGAWETPELTTGDVTVNAKYTAIEYKVPYVVGDTTVGFDTYTVEYTTVQNPEVPI